MTPSTSFGFINEYLERMEVPIKANAGFIDSYIGDAIMALFDGPADNAVQAGIGKLKALEGYNDERAKKGAPRLRIGIGVNTGPLMLGTIGGATRINCGVIGDAVNLAARVEGMTKMYGASLLVSEHTFERLSDKNAYVSREVDRVRVKGKSKSVTVIEILDGVPADIREQKLATLAAFKTGIERYHAKDASAALEMFTACAKGAPDDLAAALYVKRCNALLANGFPAEWDGVVDLAEK
jgi:class 3 adenylate cyclase